MRAELLLITRDFEACPRNWQVGWGKPVPTRRGVWTGWQPPEGR